MGYEHTMTGQNKKKGLFRVAVYFNEAEISALADEASKLGYRRAGIPIKTHKPHGFADEWLANTDGISRLLKFYAQYWRENEATRFKAAAEIAEEERRLAERKKELKL